jgi:3' terminal RNA ribose 2'-O-methyltransferase Hen1
MLLELSTTHRPATDLGFLLHKNPGAVRSVEMWFGRTHVFYPEASEERCTVALLLDVDPVGLVRRRRRSAEAGSLEPYVNDRPYVASSFMSVAIAKLFGTAMSGRSTERQELADTPIPLEARLPAVPSRGGGDLPERLFGPLGYEVDATAIRRNVAAVESHRRRTPRFPEVERGRQAEQAGPLADATRQATRSGERGAGGRTRTDDLRFTKPLTIVTRLCFR